MPLEAGGPPVRHVRKTVAFDGTAGNGAIGTVAVFTITGQVYVKKVLGFCTESLVSAGGGTVSLGVSGDVDAFIAVSTATGIAINLFWVNGSPAPAVALADGAAGAGTVQREKAIFQSVALNILTGDITDGTVIIDIWYEPITDDGRLVAA